MNNAPGSGRAYSTDIDSSTPATRPSAPALPSENWNYEVTVQRVEAIMAQIEAGELELAEVFDQFALAVEYLRQCELFLQQRQQQMDLLIEVLTDESEF